MPESIGQQLKKEREARFLTLEKASEATRIRVVFLKALEADDYSVMPSAAQGRGFLRNYAEYLDLNIDLMIEEIQRSAAPVEVSGPLPQVNLVETEIPPLVEEQEEEKPERSFLSSWFGRRPKVEPLPELESPEADLAAEQVTETQPEENSLPIEADQAEVKDEPKIGILSKMLRIFRPRAEKKESQPEPETTVEAEPEIQRNVPSQPADVIFAEIGHRLRERRELISLTYEEVERHTKLRAVFVKALEEGALDKLPSPVQMRGMLANYATFLDLDTDAILLRFADGLQARRYEKYAETPREKIQTEVVTSIPVLRSFIAGDLVFGVVMIAILIGLGIWGVGRVVNSQDDQDAAPTLPAFNLANSTPSPISLSDVDLTASLPVETPLATALEVAVDGTTTVEALPTLGADANVTVSIFAVERAFIRVSVDGELAFEGRVVPREEMTFEALDQVVILTGNAAALRVTYNGRDLGLMGAVGEVVNRVYLISGVATPTATIPPTPTNTLPVTDTPTPSTTPTLTPTSTPAGGG